MESRIKKMIPNPYSTLFLMTLIVHSCISVALPKIALNADRQFIEKSTGRVVIFHGLSYVKKHTDILAVSDETLRLASTEWGSNAARVGFVWNLLEPTPGNALYSIHFLGHFT